MSATAQPSRSTPDGEPDPAGTAAQVAAKAATLVEALPWLARFHGQTIVIKYGGHAMSDPLLAAGFAQDVVFLRFAGIRPVVVHGGGPQIDAHLERLGIRPVFAEGLRVTTPETMAVVRMVLLGQVNRDLVGALNAHGPFAVGLSGEDARMLVARRRSPSPDAGGVDLGLVGDVVAVDPATVTALLDAGRIPVVASVACDAETPGGVLNVNADTAAAALAVALGAVKLVLLTDVPGLYRSWPPEAGESRAQVLSELTDRQLEELLPTLTAGMRPKMSACLQAVRAGVAHAHVLDGRVLHALLVEVFTDAGVGTMVTAARKEPDG